MSTINKIACEVGAEMETWMRESKELHDDFTQTVGSMEFTTDGVMVRIIGSATEHGFPEALHASPLFSRRYTKLTEIGVGFGSMVSPGVVADGGFQGHEFVVKSVPATT